MYALRVKVDFPSGEIILAMQAVNGAETKLGPISCYCRIYIKFVKDDGKLNALMHKYL